MGEIRVREVDDGVIAEFRQRAARNGRSLGAELRAVLTDEASRPRREWLQRIEAWQEELRARHGVMPDSTPLIREERDRRT